MEINASGRSFVTIPVESIGIVLWVFKNQLFDSMGALGMAAIRTDEWVTGIAQGLNTFKVRVINVPVEHEVGLMDFTKWLDREGGSPREMSGRKRIRSILGMEKLDSSA
jgi:hypothetical protein